MGSKQLFQIWMERPVPRDSEDFAGRRDVFVYDLSCGGAEFMNHVGRRVGYVQAGLQMSLVILHAGGVAAQGSERRQREH